MSEIKYDSGLAGCTHPNGAGMVHKSLAVVAISMMMAGSVCAANLANVQGTVQIDKGEGFQPASPDAVIEPGDRVKAVQGPADIVYEDGSTVTVNAGQTVAVLSNPPVKGTTPSSAPIPSHVVGGFVVVGGKLLSAGSVNPVGP